jgi:AraC-like DNA-binding protein
MTRSRHLDEPILDSYFSVNPPGKTSGNRPSKSSGNLCPMWSMGLTLAGRSEHTTADGAYAIGFYDLGIIAPQANASHRWRVPVDGRPWKDLWFLFNPPPPWLSHVPLPEVLPGVYRLPLKGTGVAPQVRSALFAAHRVLHSHWPNRRELALGLMEHALQWCKAALADRTQRTDPRILRATDYLMQHLFEPLRLDRLCRHAGLAHSRLLELFRRETGTTPRMYWERERLRPAENLLRYTDKPIKEIASIVGYKYTPHFARRFRHYTGLPPLQYRKQQGGARRQA